MSVLDVVVVGNTGTGKSTLCGHLLSATQSVSSQRVDAARKRADEMGAPGKRLAWLMDRNTRDREMGTTLTCSYERLKTPSRGMTLIDVPGRRKYLKSMITGASQADAALVLVTAREGEFESSMLKEAATRDHGLLIFTAAGIAKVAIAVTHMDGVDWNQERFQTVEKEILSYLKKVGYNPETVKVVPVNALEGDNLVTRSRNSPWYAGPTVIEILQGMTPPKRDAEKPLRLCVVQTFDVGGQAVVTGRVETGSVKAGDTVVVAPQGLRCLVESLQHHGETVQVGKPGEFVGLRLSGVKPAELRRGAVVSDAQADPAGACSSLTAQLLVLSHPSEIRVGYCPVLSVHGTHVQCKITELKSRMDRRTGKEVEANPEAIKAGEAAIIELVPLKPLSLETFGTYPALGRFAMRDFGTTIAVGVIKKVERFPAKSKSRERVA